MPTVVMDGIRTFFSKTYTESKDCPLVLLISGLGSQHTAWDLAFRFRLSAAGYQVVAMDNRDAGESSSIDAPVDLAAVSRVISTGETPDVPYQLSDMAQDSVRLLDHLDVDAAHVVGISMGGMIAQTLALEHPDRVVSLTSIMSTTGDPKVGGTSPAGAQVLRMPAPQNRNDAVEASVQARRILATSGSFEEAVQRHQAKQAAHRSYNPEGVARQLAAIMASGDRTERLKSLTVPTLVIHGTADPLVDVSGGIATANAIAGAKLLLIDGMSHDLPLLHWPRVSQAVVKHLDSVTPSPLDPRIVPANLGNAARLAEIACDAFAADRERYGSGPPGFDNPATHSALIEQGHCHEIWDEGKLAGAAYMFYSGSGEWGLGSIFIDPTRQRRGLGSKLMWQLLRSHPYIKRIRLETPYANTHLHRFYESNGYRVVGATEPGSHPEASDPSFHLIKYQRDCWKPPWVAARTEILEVATSLQDDFHSGRVHGIETLRPKGLAAITSFLGGCVAELQGRPTEELPSIAEFMTAMRGYARAFDGDPWAATGGSHRYLTLWSMIRRTNLAAYGWPGEIL